jgi:hypothetical protein
MTAAAATARKDSQRVAPNPSLALIVSQDHVVTSVSDTWKATVGKKAGKKGRPPLGLRCVELCKIPGELCSYLVVWFWFERWKILKSSN